MKKEMSEVEILSKYNGSSELMGHKTIVDLLYSIITDSGYTEAALLEAINLSFVKEKIDELFKYLFIQQRYLKLNNLFNGDLSYNDRFMIGDHLFSTLDEVERAWNNKALL